MNIRPGLDEALPDVVHSAAPYTVRGHRGVVNSRGGIHHGPTAAQRSALTVQTMLTLEGYAGMINFNLGVRVG